MRAGSAAFACRVCACREGHYHLPRIHIPTADAAGAERCKREIKAKLGLDVFVLEIWEAPELWQPAPSRNY